MNRRRVIVGMKRTYTGVCVVMMKMLQWCHCECFCDGVVVVFTMVLVAMAQCFLRLDDADFVLRVKARR